METFVLSILLIISGISICIFISGTILNHRIKNKKQEKIKITMNTETAPDGMIWGKVNIGDHFIASYGNTQQELEYKMKQVLYDFQKIDPKSVKFIIESK